MKATAHIRGAKLALGALIVVVSMLVPTLADACPVCASGQEPRPWVQTALMAAMIAAPFIMAYGAYRWIRALLDTDDPDREARS